jgi:hypothetical protein
MYDQAVCALVQAMKQCLFSKKRPHQQKSQASPFPLDTKKDWECMPHEVDHIFVVI